MSFFEFPVYVQCGADEISIGATLISIIFPTIRAQLRVLPVSSIRPDSSTSSSVRFRSNGTVPFRDLWRKFSLAIIRRGPVPRQLATRPSVLHILPPLPPRPPSVAQDRPSRFPLSLFPSFARISSNRHSRRYRTEQ